MPVLKVSYTEEELKYFQSLKNGAIEAASRFSEDDLEEFAEQLKNKGELNENKS